MKCPLVIGSGKLTHKIEDTGNGWFLPAAKGLTGTVKCPANAIVCRVAPGADREVMQFGIGETNSLLCNAVFFPDSDEAWTFTAEGIRLEKTGTVLTFQTKGPLRVTRIRDYMKVHRELPFFKSMDRQHFPTAPAGWCSWYHYYFHITEAEVIRNADWLAEHLKSYGCEFVQIDEGWADNGIGYGANRNPFVTNRKKFPKGMKYLADYIRGKGLRPGIWTCPLGQSDTKLYEKHPKLFVHRADGSSAGEKPEPDPNASWELPEDKISEWGGRYPIDPTGREGQAYLVRLFKMLCHEWGYDYVKTDGLEAMYWLYMAQRAQLCDPSLDAAHAYRQAMAAMAGTMGPKRFLLNCGRGFDAVGQCQGIRTWYDVGQSWGEGVLKCMKATAQSVWLNTLTFYTDPDVLCVREPLPLAQAHAWSVIFGLTGQLLMMGDKMDALPKERIDLLKRILPVADIHPMDLYPSDGERPPSLIDLKVNRPGVGTWDVVGAFNWREKESRKTELTWWRLGLPRGEYLWLDTASGEFLTGEGSDHTITLDIAPATCRVLSVWPQLDRPQFIGSTRHITQGALDVQAVKWSARACTLSGISEVVGGDSCAIKIHVPKGYAARTMEGVEIRGEMAILTIQRQSNETVKWSVRFDKTT